jgi:hypothetical protein
MFRCRHWHKEADVPAVDKVRENRVRRWAQRLGHSVEKSRARMIHIDDLGAYRLLDDRNTVVEGVKFDATLDDIERYLRLVEAALRGDAA